MKRAYATILSSEDFYLGVKTVYLSLRRFSKEEFVVFVKSDISDSVKANLRNLGMTVIDETEPDISSEVLSEKQLADRWNNTLFKLVIFKEHGYGKLIYLDGDLLIRATLDELFDKPDFSAVSDRDFFPAYSRGGLNAGVLVVSPSEELYKALLDEIYKVAKEKEIFGDQDVINSYLREWDSEKELHLDVSYNTCFYVSESVINPRVVHFILESKPWMWTARQVFLKQIKWFLRGKTKQLSYLREYKGFLEE